MKQSIIKNSKLFILHFPKAWVNPRLWGITLRSFRITNFVLAWVNPRPWANTLRITNFAFLIIFFFSSCWTNPFWRPILFPQTKADNKWMLLIPLAFQGKATPSNQTTTVTVTGTVTNTSGTALGNHTVTFQPTGTTVTTDASGNFTVSLPPGTYTVTVTDSTGSVVGTFTLTVVTGGTTSVGIDAGRIIVTANGVTGQLDTTIPTVTITAPTIPYVSTNTGAINTKDINWSANRSGTYSIRVGGADCNSGTVVNSGSATSSANNTFTVNASSLNVGANTIRFCVADSISSNTGSNTTPITRDDTAPTVTATPTSQSSATAINVSLSCSDSSSGCDVIAYSSTGTDPAITGTTGTITAGTQYTGQLTPADNTVTTYKYLARDKAGNVSTVQSSTYTIDTSVATVTINSVSPSTTIDGTTNPQINWQANEAGTYTVRIGGTNCTDGTLATGTNITGSNLATTAITTTVNNSSLSSGSNTVRICVQNLVGNYGYITQGIVLLTSVVTTLAGPAQGTTTAGDTDGTGNAARFYVPYGITNDGTNLYVVDSWNHKIRKIVISTGAVTTLAGPPQGTIAPGDTDGFGNAARFQAPSGITYDGTNLYIIEHDNHKVRKIVVSTGAVTTLAGPPSGTYGQGDTDGTGNAARFTYPHGITYLGTNLYVADNSNCKIRKIVISTAVVTTFAGPPQGTIVTGDTDGTSSAARFYSPVGITSDGTNLYVSDNYNHKIRKIVISTGIVTTLAGPPQGSTTFGDADGTGSAARFYYPYGITNDGTNLYVADGNNNKIRKIVISTSAVTTLAGPPPGNITAGDIDGTSSVTRFNSPRGITLIGGILYVSDTSNNKIRKIAL